MDTVKSNKDILAWYHADMSAINPNVACQALNVDPSTTLVHQKRRHLNPIRVEAVKSEVGKLMSIGFLRESLYPVWLANLV